MSQVEEVDSCDVLRIMVSTDNHLGYNEKDPIRGDDSFNAFEEMLALAVKEDVDFILLGGDLFHDAVPSPNSLHRCMQLLRRYVFGDKTINFAVLGDQSVNFHGSINDTVNYEDPNLNISIPVFSIHGNHDDPSSFGCLSSLDLLSTTGLINYIGRCSDLTKVDIKPTLLQKGASKLAIYGLSHIHDSRLNRLFEQCKVEIERPDGDDDEWFHLMVLHQNRAERGHKNYLPESALPDFLNLIIWGHEHDCRIEPEHVPTKNFYISQPGSSVPTSLAEGEAIKKHVGILQIYKNKFQLKQLPLQTVRPFVFESVNLDEVAFDSSFDGEDVAEDVRAMAEQRIELMIKRSQDLLTGHEKQPKLPLIRLRLVFSREEHMFNAIRFGQSFSSRVANPADIIHFKKSINRDKKPDDNLDKEAFRKAYKSMESDATLRLEDLLERYFKNAHDSKQLELIPVNLTSEMTKAMIKQRDQNIADTMISNFEDKVLERFNDFSPNDNNLNERFKQIQASITADEVTGFLNQPKKSNIVGISGHSKAKKPVDNKPMTVGDEDLDGGKDDGYLQAPLTSAAAGHSRGRGRGRGSTKSAKGATSRLNRSSDAPTKHTFPELNISTTRTSARKATRSSTLESFVKASSAKKVITYVVSDSD